MKTKGILVLYSEDKEEIKRISLLKAPFKDELVKKMSVAMFEEEEPCIIYKTICLNKLGIEMHDNINQLEIKKEELFDISENKICDNLVLQPEVKYISFL